MIISVAFGLAGIALAALFYVVKPALPDQIAATFSGLYKLIYNKYFVDEIYDAVVVNPVVSGSREVLWKGVDVTMIDGAVNGVGQPRARHRQRAEAAAIRQYPQLRRVGSGWAAWCCCWSWA